VSFFRRLGKGVSLSGEKVQAPEKLQ